MLPVFASTVTEEPRATEPPLVNPVPAVTVTELEDRRLVSIPVTSTVTEEPSETAPPFPSPVPAVTVTELLSSLAFVIPPSLTRIP